LADAEQLCCARHVAHAQQRIERDEEVEIETTQVHAALLP
jgi:hypothetical protein